MSQETASKFTEFNRSINQFKQYLSAKSSYVEEDVVLSSWVNDFLKAVKSQAKHYTIPDYKVKFLEWVLQDILSEIDLIEFNSNKTRNRDLQRRHKNHIRVAYLNHFSTELQLYPFLFNEFDQINWNWKYREVLVYLYGLKHLGAFHEETADMDFSILKDVIFRTGKFQWEYNDVGGSLKDIKAIYEKVSNWNNQSYGKSIKRKQSQTASYQHALDSFTKLYDLFEEYDNKVRALEDEK